MDNSGSVWRFCARIISFIDIIILILHLIAIILPLVGIGYEVRVYRTKPHLPHGPEQRNSEPLENIPETKDAAITFEYVWKWVVFAFFLLLAIASVWSIFKLHKATEKGEEIHECISNARFFLIVGIIHFVLSIFEIIDKSYVLATVTIAWRLVCVVVVCIYTRELESMAVG